MTETQKRRRTAVACHYCRRRKRKCDGRQPVCSLCEEVNNSACEYPVTDEQKSISVDCTAEILDRLHRLEQSFTSFSTAISGGHQDPHPHPHPHSRSPHGIIDENFTPHSYAPSHGPTPDSAGPAAFNSPAYAGGPLSVNSIRDAAAPAPAPAPSIHVAPSTSICSPAPLAAPQRTGGAEASCAPPMAIPMSHSTTTGSLLQSRCAKALLGDYPSDIFLRVESRRPLPPALSLTPVPVDGVRFPKVSAETGRPLVDGFFDLVNPQHPVLDRASFEVLFEEAVVREPSGPRGLRSALVLLVLALGAAATDVPSLDGPWTPGVDMFDPAMRVLLSAWFDSFGDDILLPQGLYLAALYYSYLSRPLQAWRLTHMASTSIQHFPIRHRSMQQPLEENVEHQPITRLCWAIFVLECDIIAEHHLPRSGIDQVIEALSFPRCGNPPDPAMLYWLADLSARRLLNRIHHVIYDTANLAPTPIHTEEGGDSPPAPSSLISVSAELSHQLGAWFDLLPPRIKPDLGNPAPSVDETIMVLRYHAAGDIIFRPFLHQVCAAPPGTAPPELVVENAKRCLYHCRQYLAVVEHRLQAPSASLEIVLHSTLAVILLLTLASLSPILSSTVPDIDRLQIHAISLFEKWAFPGSSIESMLSILHTTRAKCQILYN